MQHVLTWFGTVLCYDRSRRKLVHCGLTEMTECLLPVDLQPVEGGFKLFCSSSSIEFLFTPESPYGSPVLPGCGTSLSRTDGAGEGRIVHLSAHGAFLSAELAKPLALNRPQPREWETYFLLSSEELSDLRGILTDRWINRSTQQLVKTPEKMLHSGFRMQIGDYMSDLADLLPLHETVRSEVIGPGSRLMAATLAVDWRVERYTLYRPLIYYTVFGERYQTLLDISLTSLFTVGGYDGDVVILTDMEDLGLSSSMADRVQVMRIQASDRAECMLSRFKITQWPWAGDYQPLLYVDADIVFDKSVDRMMYAIATSEKLLYPAEQFSFRATHVSSGSLLFSADGMAPEGPGFNAGTLGIPNLADWKDKLNLLQSLVRRGIKSPHLLGAWLEQPVVNYLVYKLRYADTELLSEYVRYDVDGAPAGIDGRAGIVHFFSNDKLARMLEYVAELDGIAAHQTCASGSTHHVAAPQELQGRGHSVLDFSLSQNVS